VTLLITASDGTNVPISQPVLVNNPDNNQLYGRWYQVCGTYTPAISGAITLSIQATPAVINTLGGADFAIDEVSFRKVAAGDATFTTQRLTNCSNEIVIFTPNNLVGTHTWDFGNGQGSQSAVGSNIYTTPGTYNVEHTVFLPNSNCPTTETIQIIVEDCGELHCDPTLTVCGDNLIVDGDFESGSFNFTSGYGPHPGGNTFQLCDGRYDIVQSSIGKTDVNFQSSGFAWDVSTDHTIGNGMGYFMLADAPCTSTSSSIVWNSSTQLIQGVTYNFSCWLSNISPDPTNNPQVVLRINGNPVSSLVVDRSQTWQELCVTYTAPFSGSFPFQLEVPPSRDGVKGSDLGIDDITLFAARPVDAAFTTSQEDCAGANITFTSTGVNPNGVTHNWNFGDGNLGSGNIASHIYDTDGIYNVMHTVTDLATGCEDVETLQLTIINCCNVRQSTFMYTPNQNQNDCSVSFDGTGIASSPTIITGFEWTYQTGQTNPVVMSTIEDHNFTFPDNGPFVVCFKVYGRTGDLTCEFEICETITANCSNNSCDINPSFYAVCDSISCPASPLGTLKNIALVQNSIFTPPVTGPGNSGGSYTVDWVIISQSQVQFFNTGTALPCFEPNPVNSQNPYGIAEITMNITYIYGQAPNLTTCSESLCATIDLDDPNCQLVFQPCNTELVNRIRENVGSEQGMNQLVKILENEIIENSNIIVSPNPFSESINIQIDNLSQVNRVYITDLTGKRLDQSWEFEKNNKPVSIDWKPQGSTQPGTYLIIIESQFGTIVKKVIFNN
jgi:hypothetical protein